jgi:hypothetical protein
MAAYLVQQGGQPVGSGQTALLISTLATTQPHWQGRTSLPASSANHIGESHRRSLRPAPSSHPEIKDAVSVRRYEHAQIARSRSPIPTGQRAPLQEQRDPTGISASRGFRRIPSKTQVPQELIGGTDWNVELFVHDAVSAAMKNCP